MLNEISNKVIIDPSLLLAENTASKTFKNIEELSKYDLKFYISHTFKKVIMDKELSTDHPVIKYFLDRAHVYRIKDLRENIEEFSKYLNIFEISEEHFKRYEIMYNNLVEGKRLNREVYEILFEEWVFLQESSWLASRLKKILNEFMKSGAVGIIIMEEKIKQLKSIYIDIDSLFGVIINKVDILKRNDMSKWIALGIGSMATFFNAGLNISNTINVVSDTFFLFDPKTRNTIRYLESIRRNGI